MRVILFFLVFFSMAFGEEIGKPFVQVGHRGNIESVSVTPDGRFVISGGCFGIIKIWDIKSGKLVKTLRGHKDNVSSVTISSDGRYIVSGSYDKTVKIWDMKSGRLFKTLKKYKRYIFSVAVSPNSKYIVVGSDDHSIKVWNIKSGRLFKTLKGHKKGDRVASVVFSPNGQYIISGGSDKMVKVWSMKKGKLLKTLSGHKDEVNSVVISSDSRYIVSSGKWDHTIKVWDIEKSKLLKTFIGREDMATSIAISPNGRYAVSGWAISRDITIWDTKNGKLFKTLAQGDSDSIASLAISSRGRYIVSGTGKSTINIWDTKKGKLLKTLKGYKYGVAYIAASSAVKYIVSGSKIGSNIQIWDVNSGKIIRVLKRENNTLLTSLAINSDGKYVVFGEESTVKVQEVKSGRLIHTLKGHNDRVTSVIISLDNKYIVSCDQKGIIKIWNIKSGKLFRSIIISENNKYDTVAISSDGMYLAFGTKNRSIKIWDMKNRKLLRTLTGDKIGADSLAFSSNRRYIISGTWVEGHIKIWDIKTAKEIISFISFNDNEWIAITPEGYYNASKNGAKHLNVLTGPMTVTSVDAYAEKFYRPDIVKLAMQGKKVDTGVKMSDIKPAPEVSMSGVPQNTDKKQVEVTLSIKDMGGGIGDVRIYRNGTAVALKSRDMQRSQKNMQYMTFVVPLQKGKNELKAIAFESTNSLRSEPAITTVTTTYVEKTKPSLHAVIIGIEKFRNSRLNLMYTKSDAIVLSDTIEQYAKRLFTSVNVTLLTSKDETSKENITKVLESLQNLNPHDMFLLFIASHGTVDMGDYYLITSNVGSTRTKKLKQDALSQAEITKLISNIPTSKKLIVLDTCHAGALGSSLNKALLNRGMSEDTAIKILSRATGTTILSASLSTQQALEGYKGHGLFSHVLLDGLKGKADLNGDGFVKTPELVDYIDERVPELSQKVFGVEQFPTVNLDGQAFPVTRVGQ